MDAVRHTFTVGCDEPKTIEGALSQQRNDQTHHPLDIKFKTNYFGCSTFNRERLL